MPLRFWLSVAVFHAVVGFAAAWAIRRSILSADWPARSRLPRRYAGDVHDYDGTPLHVTRGVGMERGTAPQFRFLCRPEICLLTLASGRPSAE